MIWDKQSGRAEVVGGSEGGFLILSVDNLSVEWEKYWEIFTLLSLYINTWLIPPFC